MDDFLLVLLKLFQQLWPYLLVLFKKEKDKDIYVFFTL